jgi:hypothetical protein
MRIARVSTRSCGLNIIGWTDLAIHTPRHISGLAQSDSESYNKSKFSLCEFLLFSQTMLLPPSTGSIHVGHEVSNVSHRVFQGHSNVSSGRSKSAKTVLSFTTLSRAVGSDTSFDTDVGSTSVSFVGELEAVLRPVANFWIGSSHLSRQKSAKSHPDSSFALRSRSLKTTSFEMHFFLVSMFPHSIVHRSRIVAAVTSR